MGAISKGRGVHMKGAIMNIWGIRGVTIGSGRFGGWWGSGTEGSEGGHEHSSRRRLLMGHFAIAATTNRITTTRRRIWGCLVVWGYCEVARVATPTRAGGGFRVEVGVDGGFGGGKWDVLVVMMFLGSGSCRSRGGFTSVTPAGRGSSNCVN